MGANGDAVDLWSLPNKVGTYTRGLFAGYSTGRPIPAKQARFEITDELRPFSERLAVFVDSRFGTGNHPEAVKFFLKERSDLKGLGISSALLDEWLKDEKGDINISAESMFKLCLAMDLGIEDGARFAYDCLYQSWFNYRVLEEAVWFFFVGAQKLFGNLAFSAACGVIEKATHRTASEDDTAEIPAVADATGYTMVLGSGMRQLVEAKYATCEDAVAALTSYLEANKDLFTGVRRSTRATYQTYFSVGGLGITPLVDLYQQKYGYKLSANGYLDVATANATDIKKKRLLWGTVNRKAWLEKNGEDWDVLHSSEIRIERHAVANMLKGDIYRGNIIALLFFVFCFEHEAEFKLGATREKLFDCFYKTTNETLVGECGMMPLHPRKAFDRLFLLSVSNANYQNPIDYLNDLLEEFYG